MKKIVITHMGGPESLEEIPQFLNRIFLDKKLIKLPLQNLLGRIIAKFRIRKTVEHYKIIGGFSPINSITYAISKKLDEKFRKDGVEFEVKFTHISPILKESQERLYVFPLYPQYSKFLTGAIEEKLPNSKIVKSWYDEEEYLNCIKIRIEDSIKNLETSDVNLLFIAHSLPEICIKMGDLYEEEINENFRILSSKFSRFKSQLAYIGSVGIKKWIGPSAKDIITKFSGKNLVVIYLSMAMDNVEVLYDIDYELRTIALESGVKKFVRVNLPNDDKDFISAIESIIRRRLL